MSDDKECYIEYKHYDKIIRFSNLNPGMSVPEFHNQCRLMALAIGYHPDNIEEYFGEDWNE